MDINIFSLYGEMNVTNSCRCISFRSRANPKRVIHIKIKAILFDVNIIERHNLRRYFVHARIKKPLKFVQLFWTKKYYVFFKTVKLRRRIKKSLY